MQKHNSKNMQKPHDICRTLSTKQILRFNSVSERRHLKIPQHFKFNHLSSEMLNLDGNYAQRGRMASTDEESICKL